MRLPRLIAGPITVKSSRTPEPTLPYAASPWCKAKPAEMTARNTPAPFAASSCPRARRRSGPIAQHQLDQLFLAQTLALAAAHLALQSPCLLAACLLPACVLVVT